MLRRALPVYEVDSSIVGTRGIQDSLMREREEKGAKRIGILFYKSVGLTLNDKYRPLTGVTLNRKILGTRDARIRSTALYNI